MTGHIFIDGSESHGPLALRSLMYGEGLFETFRFRGAYPTRLHAHMERMRMGAAVLGLPFPGTDAITGDIDHALAVSHIGDAYVKVCLLADGTGVYFDDPGSSVLMVAVRPYAAPRAAVDIALSPYSRNTGSPIAGIKSLNYLESTLVRRWAHASGYHEAVMLNEHGHVAEASSANVFWVSDGSVYTPSTDCGILPGVVRDVVIEASSEMGIDVVQGAFSPEELGCAELVFLTSSLIGMQPVRRLDGRDLDTSFGVFEGLKNAVDSKLGW